MKKRIYLILFLLIVSLLYLFYSCNSTNKSDHLPTPIVECGVAKVSGKFRGIDRLRQHGEVLGISFAVPKPLTGGYENHEVEIKEDGRFSFEIPIETSPTLGYFEFPKRGFYPVIPLISSEETVFDFYYKGEKLHIEWKDGPDFLIGNSDPWYDALFEVLSGEPLSLSAWGHYNLDTLKHFIANPKDYIPFSLKYDLENSLEILEKDKRIPKKALDLFSNEVRLMRIPQFIHFSGDIWNMYETFYKIENNINKEELKNELDSTTYIPPNPDISYWVFLKEFDLNNPYYLYTKKFSYILQMLLENEILSIPPIEDNQIDEWMKQTKNRLTNLVGFDDGMFYDVLLCNAYSQQFMNRQEPLSEKQIENIRSYYKGGEIEKILLRENERIVMLDKKRHQTIVNPTPEVEKNKLINAIISKYKEKVVIVDYWATWCGPCLEAISKMSDMKTKFINKDVVFVYITTESSPKDRWEEVIPGIGGEHYYLTQDEWEYLLDEFNFNSIPTYQIYNKKGKFQEQFTGSLGAKAMQRKIEKLLKIWK